MPSHGQSASVDWWVLARYLGRYTVGYGGGTVALAFLLPTTYRPYALIALVATGALLVGKAVVESGGAGPVSGVESGGAGLSLAARGESSVAPRETDPSGVGELFYAVGLVAFGVAALAHLL
jgi:hypothetical protein